MIQLSPIWLTAAVSVFIPLVVGLITKSKATTLEKTLINLLASAVVGGITTALATNGSVDPAAWLVGMGVAFGSSVVSHYNLWKPTGVSATVQNVAPGVGLGTAASPAADFLTALASIAKSTVPTLLSGDVTGTGAGTMITTPPPEGMPS